MKKINVTFCVTKITPQNNYLLCVTRRKAVLKRWCMIADQQIMLFAVMLPHFGLFEPGSDVFETLRNYIAICNNSEARRDLSTINGAYHMFRMAVTRVYENSPIVYSEMELDTSVGPVDFN